MAIWYFLVIYLFIKVSNFLFSNNIYIYIYSDSKISVSWYCFGLNSGLNQVQMFRSMSKTAVAGVSFFPLNSWLSSGSNKLLFSPSSCSFTNQIIQFSLQRELNAPCWPRSMTPSVVKVLLRSPSPHAAPAQAKRQLDAGLTLLKACLNDLWAPRQQRGRPGRAPGEHVRKAGGRRTFQSGSNIADKNQLIELELPIRSMKPGRVQKAFVNTSRLRS